VQFSPNGALNAVIVTDCQELELCIYECGCCEFKSDDSVKGVYEELEYVLNQFD
jgi:hypothetical protein